MTIFLSRFRESAPSSALSLVAGFAAACVRLVTFGLADRETAIAERTRDLSCQIADPVFGTPGRVLRRALASTVWDIWGRMRDNDRTTIPGGILFAFAIPGAIQAVFFSATNGGTLHLAANLAFAVGMGVFVFTFLSSPRALNLTLMRYAAAAAGVAALISGATVHPQDTIATLGSVSLIVSSAGWFTLSAGTFFAPQRRSVLHIGAMITVAGGILLAVAETAAAIDYEWFDLGRKITAVQIAVATLAVDVALSELWRFANVTKPPSRVGSWFAERVALRSPAGDVVAVPEQDRSVADTERVVGIKT